MDKAQERFRCPCGIPVEYDPSDGWQHADGSISHDGEFYPHSVSDLMEEHGGHTAGKGKPRRDAPDVARGAGQAGQGSFGGVAPDSGRDGDGGKPPAPLRALAEHPKVARDLAKLPKNVQAAYHERVDGLRRGEAHSSTHALTGPLKGWQGTNLNFLNRVVHRYDGGELHVLSAGNHDEAYDQGARRLGHVPAAALYDKPERWQFKQREWDAHDRHNIEHTKPFGNYTLHAQPKYDDGDRQLHVTTPEGQVVGEAYTGEHPSRPGHIELAPEVHPDHRRKGIGTALYNYAEELAGRPAAPASEHTDAAKAFWQSRRHKEARYTPPRERLFGPTFGLDTRLWTDDKLRPAVREDVITRFDAFCHEHGYEGWHRWAKIVFFGSEASEWTSKALVGNGDFDLSIGIHYPALRATVPGFAGLADEIIAAGLTQEMHEALNADDMWVAVDSMRPFWLPREAAARSASTLTSSWSSTMITPAVPGSAAAESAYEASFALGATRRSATSGNITLGPRSVISPGGKPSTPLPDGWDWIGPFSQTWYANLQGWDIARIRPYAAYDVVADEWIVRPPHLPDWSMTDFPEGEGLTDEVHGIVLMAEGILKMPEPYRTQNGAALWEFVHGNRSDAFGPNGEGWWDSRNVVEKALDQKGLMQKLWECHDRAQQAPESLASPSDWSNSPVAAR